jgi:hypothetical protein
LVVDNIFGIPEQEETDMINAARFYNDNRPHRFKTYWLRYYPGTTIVPLAMQSGVINGAEFELLKRGYGSKTPATGGTKVDPAFAKFQVFFILMQYLPTRLNHWIIERGWVTKFPHFPWVGHLVLRSFDLLDLRERHEVTGTRYVTRTFMYSWKAIFRPLRAIIDPAPENHGREHKRHRSTLNVGPGAVKQIGSSPAVAAASPDPS